MKSVNELEVYLPKNLRDVDASDQTVIPRMAKDIGAINAIESAIKKIPTKHKVHIGDSRILGFLASESVHLVVTSPPYWTLKHYEKHDSQLGDFQDYEKFLDELDKVWMECFRILVPGGRVVCVVGDVCLSRRKNNGVHTVVPLHASIQERCRKIGFMNLAPIIWHKIANVVHESCGNGGGFLGKPYEPNSVIKNDIEFILMERKPGGYRQPANVERLLSIISAENHKNWFQQVWSGITGASTKNHPAPYPLELAERLVRMFSFVGDTVLDPFMGTGTTNVAAARWGRNSIGVEVIPSYADMAVKRLNLEIGGIFAKSKVEQIGGEAIGREIPKTPARRRGQRNSTLLENTL